VSEPPVHLSWNATPLVGNKPLDVAFVDKSENSTEWYWEFGDTGTSSVRNLTYTYANAGLFPVNHGVGNGTGIWEWDNGTVSIQVNEPAPVAAFSCIPLLGDYPLLVTCTDASTGATDWNWSFSDHNVSILQNPTNTYGWAGVFDVNLTVCGPSGCDVELKLGYITVNAPAAGQKAISLITNATDFRCGLIPFVVQFNATAVNGTVTSWFWDFGDFIAPLNQSTQQNDTHTYNSVGNFLVNLTVGFDDSTYLTKYTIVHVCEPVRPEQEKISDFSFSVLLLFAFGLMIYGFKDNQNKYYGNIYAHGIAAVLFFLASLMIIGGTVATISPMVNQTVENLTTEGANLTTFDYIVKVIPIHDIGLGYFLAFLGGALTVFVVLMVVDSRAEVNAENAESEEE
jgi:PKD repeat protein